MGDDLIFTDARRVIGEPAEPFTPARRSLFRTQIPLDANQLAVHHHDDAAAQIDDAFAWRSTLENDIPYANFPVRVAHDAPRG